jgi:hypothetical protein
MGRDLSRFRGNVAAKLATGIQREHAQGGIISHVDGYRREINFSGLAKYVDIIYRVSCSMVEFEEHAELQFRPANSVQLLRGGRYAKLQHSAGVVGAVNAHTSILFSFTGFEYCRHVFH